MASLVQQELNSSGRNGRGVKQAGFLVLYKTSMPSILVETGFLSQPDEERYLASEKGQAEMARSLFKAFKSYKSSLESGTLKTDGSSEHADSVPKEEVKPAKEETVLKPDSATEKKTVDTTAPEKHPSKPKPEPVAKKEISGKETDENDRIVFRVQFLLSPKELPAGSPQFNGVKDSRMEKVGNVYKYTSGYFLKLDDAMALQNKMRSNGFPDAFVVAYLNNKRISIKEVRERMKKSD